MLLGDAHFSGLPRQVFVRKFPEDLRDFLKLEDFHHYYSRAKIAGQICAVSLSKDAEKKRRHNPVTRPTADDYIAGHQVGEMNLYVDGILKLVQAVQAEKMTYAGKVDEEDLTNDIDLHFFYPILVTSGPLYECWLGPRRKPHYRRVHRVPFIHRMQEPDRRLIEDHIDVVDAEGLAGLLRSIDRETDRMAAAIRKHRKVLVEAARKSKRRLERFSKKRRLRFIAGEEDLIW